MSKGENMVERATRALQSKLFDTWGIILSPSGEELTRAVMEALTEPTAEMLAAGDLPGWDDNISVGLAKDVWQTMLRTALSQPNDEGDGK